MIATTLSFATTPTSQAFAAMPAPNDAIQGSPDLNLDGSNGGDITACYTVPSGISQVDVQVLGQGGDTGELAPSGYPNHIAGNGGLGQLIHARIPVTPGQVLLAHIPPGQPLSVVYGTGLGGGGGMSYVANTEPGITCSDFNIPGVTQKASAQPTNPASFLVVAAGGGGGGGMGSDSSGGNGGNAGMPNGSGGQAGGANDQKDGGPGGGGTQTAGGGGGHSGCFYLVSAFSTYCAYNGAAGGFFAGGAGGQFLFEHGTNGQGGGGGQGWYGGGGGASSINSGGAGGGGGGSSHVASNVTVLSVGLGPFGGTEQSAEAYVKIVPVVKPSVVLTSSHNPSSQGTAVTFTASVNPAVDGTIEFNVDIASQQCSVLYYDPFTGQPVTFCIPLAYTTLADVPLVNGVATFTTSSLGIRNNIITANFLAHDLYDGAFAQVTQSVVAPVSVINQSTDQTARYGDSVTFTYGAPGGTAQQWQVAHVLTKTPTVTYAPFTDIPGQTTNALTFAAKDDLAKYRSLVTNGADTVMTREFLLHVTPAPLQVVGTSQTIPWGSSPAALSATFNGLKFNDTPTSFSGAVTVTAPTLSTDVGTYPVHVTGTLANPNYSPITYADGAITVTKRPVTITANELTSEYGSEPAFSAHASGLLSPDTLAGLGALTFAASPKPNDTIPLQYFPPGDYQVTPGGLPDNAHYAFNYVGAPWHVRDTTGPDAPTIENFVWTPGFGQFRRTGPTTIVGYGQGSLSWSYAPDLYGTARYLGVWVDCTTHQVVGQLFDTQIAKFGWTINIPSYPEGVRCLSIQGVDYFGNVGKVSDPYTFITDFTPPAVSVAFAAGTRFIPAASPNPAYTGETTPSFVVTTEANATVNVSVADAAGNVLTTASTVTGTSGTFSVTPASALPEGAITVTASAMDEAGNGNSAVLAFVVDNTPPAVTSTRTPAPNANGWNNGPVLVQFNATDAASGMAAGAGAYSVTLSGDGRDQSASHTFADLAGNSTVSTVTGISIDRTPPTISGARTPANAAGWTNGAVTVTFTCGDALSGVDTCAAPKTIASEGAGQSATGTATDKAGNTASATVSGINIDLTPPELTVQRVPAPNANGWNNATVVVAFSCLDRLSGLVDCPDVFFIGEGAGQNVTGTATDVAGNIGSLTVSGINVDKTPPTISASRTPANARGWNNADVTVTFTCGDALSGVASCTPSVTLTAEGAGQGTSGSATDKAGNTASTSLSGINVDKTAPTITGARTAPNAYGWNNTDVTVTYTCSDALSGVASCAAPQTRGEGANQSATGIATDVAGNTASTTLTNINVDKTNPTITASRAPTANASGWNNSSVTVSFACSDALSGVASCAAPITLSGEGASQSASGGAMDRAGNTASATLDAVNIDLTKPTITANAMTSDGLTYTAGAWTNKTVTVHYTCGDALSGVATCASDAALAADGGGQNASGTAMDKADNAASTTFGPINIDKTPPALTVPSDISVDATATTGAGVTFTATATDNHSTPTVSCAPASGSTFAIGATTVSCTATDAVGNTTTGTFKVNVRGPAQQMARLADTITADNAGTVAASLDSKLLAAQDQFARGSVKASCNTLNAVANETRAQDGKKILDAVATDILHTLARIESAAGCAP